MVVVKGIFHQGQDCFSLAWCIAFIILPSSKNEHTVIISGSLFGHFFYNSVFPATWFCLIFLFNAVELVDILCEWLQPLTSRCHFKKMCSYIQRKRDRTVSGAMLRSILSVSVFSKGEHVCRSKCLLHLWLLSSASMLISFKCAVMVSLFQPSNVFLDDAQQIVCLNYDIQGQPCR